MARGGRLESEWMEHEEQPGESVHPGSCQRGGGLRHWRDGNVQAVMKFSWEREVHVRH